MNRVWVKRWKSSDRIAAKTATYAINAAELGLNQRKESTQTLKIMELGDTLAVITIRIDNKHTYWIKIYY